jgi:ribosomal protein S18 acetylase RimI-like enzyme
MGLTILSGNGSATITPGAGRTFSPAFTLRGGAQRGNFLFRGGRPVYPQAMIACNLSIRRATVADVYQLAPLFDGYRQFYRQPSDLAGARGFLAERISREQSVVFFAHASPPNLGTALSEPAGMAQLYPTYSSVSLGDRWILNDLFVAPAFRRMGIARALTERCMQHCRDTRAGAMMLLTEANNASAQALYESLGWKRDLEYWRYTWKPA